METVFAFVAIPQRAGPRTAMRRLPASVKVYFVAASLFFAAPASVRAGSGITPFG